MIIPITIRWISLTHLNNWHNSSWSQDFISTLIISGHSIALFHYEISNLQLFHSLLSHLLIYHSSLFKRVLLMSHAHWGQLQNQCHWARSYLEEFYMFINSHYGNQLQNLIRLIQLLPFIFTLLLYIVEAFYGTINAV